MTFYSLSSELTTNLERIEQHWQSGLTGELKGKHGTLFYTQHKAEEAKLTVLLVGGRIESSHKYRELIWELNKNNFTVFCCDHIGQGQSKRLTSNPHIGYVPNFSDYAEDLNTFVSHIITPKLTTELVILAHSMGAGISVEYLSRFDAPCIGAFLSAPMLGINTAPFPKWLATALASTACAFGAGKHFAIGQKGYIDKAFNGNDLTHCHSRYKAFRDLYNQSPHLQLGGVSFGWLHTVFNWCDALPNITTSIPMHIALAQQDSIVDNQATLHWAKQQRRASVSHYANAKHELLNEDDKVRTAVLNQFYNFCEALTSPMAEIGS